MATLDQTIRLIFEGIDRTGQATDSVVKGLQGVSTAANKATEPLADFTADILKIEAALIGAGAALVTYSAAISQDFEQSFREIATLIDVPLEGLESFRNEILEYAQTSTGSLEEITAATYQAISAGVAWEDSLRALAIAEELAIAGNTDLATGLDALIPVLNAYGAGIDEAAGFADILFQTVRGGRTTIPELAASLSTVTPIAAAAGISFDEIAAAVAVLTANGAPTAQALTQIRSAIVAYLKPSSQARDLSESLGLQFSATSVRSKGLAQSLQEATAATGGNAEQLAVLFGRVEGLTSVLSLGGTNAEQFADALNANADAAGGVSEAYNKMIGNIDTGADAGRVALVRLGDAFREAFIESKAAITDIVNAIADSIGGENFEALLAQIQRFGEEIAVILREIATNLPEALESADLSGFENGIQQVADALRGFLGDIDITTVDGLRTAIEKVGNAFDKFGTFTATAIEQIGPFFNTLAGLVDSALEADSAFFAFAGSVGGLALAVNTILPALNTALLAVLAIGGTGGAIPTAAKAAALLVTALKAGGAALVAFASTTAGAVAGAAALGVGIGTIIDKATGASDKLADFFSDLDDLDTKAKVTGDNMRITAESLGILSGAVVGLGFEEAGRKLGEFEQENKALIQTLDLENETIDRLQQSFAEQGLIYDEATGQVREFEGAIYSVATAADLAAAQFEDGRRIIAQYTDESGELVKVYEDISGSSAEAEQSLRSLLTGTLDSAEAFNRFAADTGVAKDKILEFATELEKAEIEAQAEIDISEIEGKTKIALAQIGTLETVALAKVELDIAEVQANAQVATALIGGIAETAASTNENIRTVIEAIAGLDDADKLAFSKQQQFKKQLEIENARIDQQLDLQTRLTEAQINYYQESTRRLRTGDAIIEINGDGLEPELEAFMFAILRRVQVRAQQDVAGFLLGLPA